MKIHNFMEDVVFKMVDKLLSNNQNICQCEQCKLDIAAIALNNLPTYYVVSEKGELYSKVREMEVQFGVDIIREVTKAMDIVKRQPHHIC